MAAEAVETAEQVFEVAFPARPLTWEDLQVVPDDRYWAYELVEGNLLVAPAPSARHQSCVLSLGVLLRTACPPELKALVAPFDYTPRPGYVLQPDVLVARRSDVLEQRVVAPPVLAVEVLSPSSRTIDRSLKRLVYQETGVEHYWVVDPEAPSVEAWVLRDGAYVAAGTARGDERLHADAPFAVDVVPSDLLDE